MTKMYRQNPLMNFFTPLAHAPTVRKSSYCSIPYTPGTEVRLHDRDSSLCLWLLFIIVQQ